MWGVGLGVKERSEAQWLLAALSALHELNILEA